MRTRELFRYLVAMIIALSTTVNAMAQERALKIYFNENGDTATGPRILVKDDNGNYELPKGLKVTLGGAVWADKARFWEMFQRDVSDRVIAAYTASDKKESKLTLSFVDRNGKSTMPYEVNSIQWNVMNDLLSSSILDLLDNYRITTKCIPANGTGWSSTDEKWDMNFLVKTTTFTQKNVPWRENDVLNGLKSFEIGEQCWRKSPLGILINHQVELDDKCRTFIKAGWNGSNTNSNITDSDDSNWAFKVKFTLPDIRMRSYKCTVDNNFNVTLGQIDNNIIVGERAKHALRGYIAAHAGAVVPIEAPTNPEDIDPNDFHYEYEADKNKINIHTYTGVIYEAKVAGDIPVTVKLMRGDRLVCSYPQTIHVYSNDPTRSEIAIGFLNGNKGYDVTVGDQNAQIQGIITKYGENITLSNGTSGYHFEYSEDSNGEIIDIDPLTGKITAKKEGDVHVSAVLKNGGTIRSNTYTYSLHVFAQHEGLEFRRINTYHYSDESNQYSYTEYVGWPVSIPVTRYADRTIWNVATTSSNANYDWKSNNLLRVNTSINGAGSNYGVNDWKQIASFSTGEYNYWRAICQEIAFDVYVPKYTKSVTQYSFAGNAAIGSKKTHSTGRNSYSDGSCKYGFEINYLNQKWNNGEPVNEQITLEEANTKLQNRSWNTNAGSVTETFARSGASSYTSNVGAANALNREINNVDADDSYKHKSYTVYFAAMAYLWNNESYPGDVSIGFKGIPTYEYYSTITYYNNDGTEDVWYKTDTLKTTDKTESFKMPNTIKNLPERVGYEFLGWSTDPNATTAEYPGKDGDFYPYDDVNGGGKGPVDLYAVWRPNTYTVTLDHNDGTGTIEQAYVVYGGNMPLVDTKGNTLNIPTRDGYVFLGYTTEMNGGETYYSLDWQGNLVSYSQWPKAENGTLYAQWEKIYKITLDADGGTFDGSVSTWPETSILEKNEGSLVLQVRTNQTECAQVYCSNRINIKPGYKLLGWYTEPQSEGDAEHPERPHKGTLVYSIEPGNNFSYHFYAVPNTPNAWNADGKWIGTSDLTLYAHYQIIFEVEDDVVTFLDMNPKNCVSGEDLTAALDYAKKNGAKLINTLDMTHPDTGADQLGGEGIMKAFEDAKEETNSIVSPNALILFTSTWPSQRTTNAVTLNKNGGECQNLVVTDRYSMRIPVNFKADKASYARDAQVNDAATEQASKSTWGTLCLPYPIKNNTNGVKFYWLQSTANNYMEFEEFGDNAIIPANTPVLYSRTDGDVSSKINIVEANVNVPENADYTPVIIDYANPKKGTYPLESASATLQDWEFRGNLKTNIFYGAKYVGKIEENAQKVDNGDVYYFKQNKFTHLTPAMTKMVNGKEVHYNAGKMTIFPYRAYFYKKGVNGSPAKVSAYSILVVDEFGNTTDITNAVFGDGEGDGKIYDLNGIRVMQPVKGRLYIVNGQKKVYR